MARTFDDLAAYRISLWGERDRRWQRCFTISAMFGGLALAAIHLAPPRDEEIARGDRVPERLAKLILEAPPRAATPRPAAEPEIARAPDASAAVKPGPAPRTAPTPSPAPRPKRAPRTPEARSETGRERARRQVTEQLGTVKSQLSDVLSDVSSSLASSSDPTPANRSARRRRPRSGRSAAQLASVTGPLPVVDLPSSKLESRSIEIESVETVSGAESVAGEPSERFRARTDAQLLAVVRKYAPGIRFCYDNELEKAERLGGKWVVSITVAASGRVVDVQVVQDTVRSRGLTSCALAQIEAWKFPEIEAGTVTFQAPFVFTPPQ